MDSSTSRQLQNSSYDKIVEPNSLQLHSSKQSKSCFRKLFSWNREKPRHNSEYIDKKFSQPYNDVAPELKVIGGLGRINCVNKKQKQALVNRPTQVQKISHTTTKVLPNFSLTEELKPLACERRKKFSTHKHVERVKFAENLEEIEIISSESKRFNNENPLNLDLSALNEYQKQKSDAEDVERRRNFQMIRRTMETMKLKSVGAEEIMQEERDAKFKLPAFFNIAECDDDKKATTKKIDEDEAGDIN